LTYDNIKLIIYIKLLRIWSAD